MKKKTKRLLALLAAGTICLPILDNGLTKLHDAWKKREEKRAELQSKKDDIVSALKAHNGINESEELPKSPDKTGSFVRAYGNSVTDAHAKVHDAILANASRW